MRQTARWANDPANKAATGAILVKYMHADPAVMNTMIHVHFTDDLQAADVQPQIDVAAHYANFPTFPASATMIAPATPAKR